MPALSAPPAPSLLFGSSPDITKLLHTARRLAPVRWSILILGERGTGKTALASWIHDRSRPREAFVKVSAASIPPRMEHAYLAGHIRGSFTGAVADQLGLFESANRGTFFIDEIGLASPSVQGVLLQLLDDGELTRFDEVRRRQVDVRLIAATNADFDEMIAQKTFRADLRDRFGYLTLRLPPLAARRDEILPLAAHFLARYAAELKLAQAPALSRGGRDCLRDAPWPGNIRDRVGLPVHRGPSGAGLWPSGEIMRSDLTVASPAHFPNSHVGAQGYAVLQPQICPAVDVWLMHATDILAASRDAAR